MFHVDQFRRYRHGPRQHAEPAERIDLFIFAQYVRRDRLAADAMKAVGADHIFAIDPDGLVAGTIGYERGIGFEVVQPHIVGVVHHLAAETVARLVEVARQFGLAIDEDGIAAGIFVEIDAIQHPVMGNVESLVDFAFAIHPLAALRLAHQFGETVLQDAGADAAQHVLAAVFFQHDGVDALQMQELGQQQAGRPATDDTDLDFHLYVLPFRYFLQIPRRKQMEGQAFVLYNSNRPSARSRPAIRVFNLFGESGDLPDVVHCETIAARSVLHDWEFEVHRHARLHQVLLIESGGGQATLEARV